jgi:hypothetical protein
MIPMVENGKIVSFSEWILSESVKPKQIDYGLNFKECNNKEIKNIQNMYLTAFNFNAIHIVGLIDNEVTFAPLEDYPNDIFSKDVLQMVEYMSDTKGNRNKSSLKVFNYVFYVLLEIIKTSKTEIFYFSSAHDKLSNLYSKIVQNKYFLGYLASEGFSFIEGTEGKFLFKKQKKGK